MPPMADESRIIETERQLLQALCQESCEESVRESDRRALAEYGWRDPVHDIIFRFVVAQSKGVGIPLRERLSSLLTRKGFPDVEWEEFFRPASLSREKIEDLIRQLLGSH
jgi:hypothetical protein